MRNSIDLARVLLLALILIAPSAASAAALEDFLDEVDIRASKDFGEFKADLSLTFNVSEGKVNGMFEVMSKASDVYMCLRVGEVAHQPIDRVINVYQRYRGQGWGVIAKNLGIKPGSDEFHALKSGRLPNHQASASSSQKKNNKGDKGKK
jgi:hypothetical protein